MSNFIPDFPPVTREEFDRFYAAAQKQEVPKVVSLDLMLAEFLANAGVEPDLSNRAITHIMKAGRFNPSRDEKAERMERQLAVDAFRQAFQHLMADNGTGLTQRNAHAALGLERLDESGKPENFKDSRLRFSELELVSVMQEAHQLNLAENSYQRWQQKMNEMLKQRNQSNRWMN